MRLMACTPLMEHAPFCSYTSVPSRQDFCWSCVWLIRGAHSTFKMLNKEMEGVQAIPGTPLNFMFGGMKRNRDRGEALKEESMNIGFIADIFDE